MSYSCCEQLLASSNEQIQGNHMLSKAKLFLAHPGRLPAVPIKLRKLWKLLMVEATDAMQHNCLHRMPSAQGQTGLWQATCMQCTQYVRNAPKAVDTCTLTAEQVPGCCV